MKKLTSIILTLAMLLALCSTAMAAEPEVQVSEEAKELAEVYTIDTEFSTIKQNEYGAYAMDVSTETEEAVVPVGRLDIRLWVQEDVDAALARPDVSGEVKAYISEQANKIQQMSPMPETTATLFSIDLLPQTRSTATMTTTYNGMKMKADQLYSYNGSTGFKNLEKGIRAKTVANTVLQICLEAAGVVSTVVSLINSALSIFEAAMGATVVAGTPQDYLQINLAFDDVKQWTYGYMYNEWRLGYSSQKVTLTTYEYCQYYVIGDRGYKHTSDDIPLYVTKQSSAFGSPWATAYNNLNNPVAEWVSFYVKGYKYLF